ncbi:MAG: ATP-binding cassette domain-containing protein, partial [Oscillospiraceae bacterium]
ASVGLSESVLQKSPFDLSGGQKRRVALAGVIAMRPDVLILDEPTAGLDPRGRDEILQYIMGYNREYGATVVFVTHSMEDIARTVGRIIVMKGGGILMSGTPREIFSRADEITRAGLTVPQVTRVMAELSRCGIPVDTSSYILEDALASVLSLCKGGARNA